MWFYVTSRYFTNESYLAGRFFPVDPTAVQRQNDTSRQAYAGTYTYDNNGRVTWAINDKQKISGWYAYQYKVDPLVDAAGRQPCRRSPSRITTWNTQLSTTKWTYTATNRLLFEAGVAAGASPDTILLNPETVGIVPRTGKPGAALHRHRGPDGRLHLPRARPASTSTTGCPASRSTCASSYVTGSHSLKVGFEAAAWVFLARRQQRLDGRHLVHVHERRARLRQPQRAGHRVAGQPDANIGIFVQDRWTLDRLTLSGGVRFDYLNTSTEPFTLGPHRWLPNRNVVFPAVEDVPNWKDINPRVAVAYDLFGNGRTALKASASRGVQQESIAIARLNNPANTVATNTNRTWADANNNLIPDCVLTSPVANGECGPNLNVNFGSAVPATVYSRDIMEGWGVRPSNWEFSTSLQQQLVPRVSATLGFFRRINGNFWVTDNEALAATDFTQYSVTIPTDSRLPGGGGGTLSGLFDQNINPAARNVVKDAGQFGKQQQQYTGFDLTIDARLQNGVYLQGGVNAGTTMTDNCDVVDEVPESLGGQSRDFCHMATPYLAQYKALASYTLPYGVRLSGTLQSLPFGQAAIQTGVAANNVYNNANRLTSTTLGRPFTLAQQNVNLIYPGTFYGDRLNQVDIRLTKIVNVGRGRIDFNVDFYNAFNSDVIIAENFAFGPAFRRPLTVIQPRFVKFMARWDF